MFDEKEFQQKVQRVETLIREIEATADPDTRAKAVELVQSLMDFHGAGLERAMEIIHETGETGYAIFDRLADDRLTSGLLLLYNLHPHDLETRVAGALEKVRPYLRSHGGDVELLGAEDGAVRLSMKGSCNGCPSSSMTLKLAIEEAIYEAAPDVSAIEVEGVTEERQTQGAAGLVQLGKPARRNSETHEQNGDGRWESVSGLETIARSSVRALDVRGRSVLFCRLGETFYAYGSVCPGCEKALQDARLEANSLVCPGCGQRYEVERAGRSTDRPALQLEPFPLLMERQEGRAKVALPAPAAI